MLRGQTGVEGKGGKEESSWINGGGNETERGTRMRGAGGGQASWGNDPRCLPKGAINRNFINTLAGMSLSACTYIGTGKWEIDK